MWHFLFRSDRRCCRSPARRRAATQSGETTAQEHRGQLALGGGRIRQVGQRLQFTGQLGGKLPGCVLEQRLIESPSFQEALGGTWAHRCRSHSQQGQPCILQSLPVLRCRESQADDGIVAMPAREFGKAMLAPGRQHRYLAGDYHFAVGQRSRIQILEKIGGGNAPFPASALHHHDRIECHRTCRPFSCRIGVGNRSAPGAEITDRPVRDMRRGHRQHRCMLRHQ